MRRKNIAGIIFLLISLILFLSLSCPVFAFRDTAVGSSPEYAPGEVLVKFKDGAEPQKVLNGVNMESAVIERVYSINSAAAKFRKDYKLERDSDGWYSFLGKNYKEISDIPDEEAFKEIYKSMSEQEQALYRTYKVKLPGEVSVEEAVTRLKENPGI
jgi:hypothetical protein